MTQIMENIGQKLARIRKSAGLTQTDIAASMKCSGGYISKVEHGKLPANEGFVENFLKACKPHLTVAKFQEYSAQIKELQQTQPVGNATSKSVSLAQDLFVENYVNNSDEFKKAFESAHELSVLGMGQMRMLFSYSGAIQNILYKGGKVNFVLCNPESAAIEMASKVEFSGLNKTLTKQEHWAAIGRFGSLSKDSKYQNGLNIKLIDFLPAFTIYGFDLNSSEAKLFVWITAFKEPSDKRPGFMLSSQDGYWFNFFVAQFEHFWSWEEAKSLNISDENYRLEFEKQKR